MHGPPPCVGRASKATPVTVRILGREPCTKLPEGEPDRQGDRDKPGRSSVPSTGLFELILTPSASRMYPRNCGPTAWIGLGFIATTFALSPSASAQTGQEVFERAVTEYERRLQDIESYSITQDFMGFSSVVLWERQQLDGRPVFVPRRSQTALQPGALVGEGTDYYGTSSWEDPFRHFLEWGSAATLEGRDVVGGVGVLVVRVDDFQGAEFGITPGTFAEGHFRPAVGRFYLDPDRYLIRRIDAEGSLSYAGSARDVRIIADFTDYRTQAGVLHPFTIRIDARGIQSARSDVEQQRARRELDELNEQLDALPEEQRGSLEELLRVQIDRLQQITEGSTILTVRTVGIESTGVTNPR